MENTIQKHLSEVGLMMAGIVEDVYKSKPTVFSMVHKHTKILHEWEAHLPPQMKLAELKKTQGNVFIEPHRRSLVLVHVMYFGAQILLQRRLLVAMAQCRLNRKWTLDGTPAEGTLVQQQCVAAAEETIELLDVLGYTRHMFRRCWLCM